MSETAVYKPALAVRLIFSFGILGIFALWIALLFLVFGGTQLAVFLGLFAVYLAPGFGKESIIPILTAAGCPLWAILSGIVIIDMVLGIIIAFNFDLLEKIPLLGKVLTFFTTRTAKLLQEHRWIAGLATTGLFLFMYIPFMGSSAINTAIIGRILSIHPKILLPVIFTGSICATLTVALGAKAVINLWFINPWYAVAAVLAGAAVIFILWQLWKRYISPRFEKDTE